MRYIILLGAVLVLVGCGSSRGGGAGEVKSDTAHNPVAQSAQEMAASHEGTADRKQHSDHSDSH